MPAWELRLALPGLPLWLLWQLALEAVQAALQDQETPYFALLSLSLALFWGLLLHPMQDLTRVSASTECSNILSVQFIGPPL